MTIGQFDSGVGMMKLWKMGLGGAVVLGTLGVAVLLLHRRPAGIDEKMASLVGAASLDCGRAEVRLGSESNIRCGSLPFLVGAETLNADLVKAFNAKVAFRGRFDYGGNSGYSFGICGDGKGAVYFVSSFQPSPINEWLGKAPIIHVYACSQPRVQGGGSTKQLICGDGSDCGFKYPGG